MTLVERVHDVLATAGIPHALIGAAALAAHGVSRSTLDIDLLVMDRRALDEALWAGLGVQGVSVDVRRGDEDDPLAGVVRLQHSSERPVDIVVGRHAWQQRAIERALPASGIVPVVRADDLVLLKLYAGGTQDRWDVEQVLAAVPDRAALVAAVDTAIAELPGSLQAQWADWRPR